MKPLSIIPAIVFFALFACKKSNSPFIVDSKIRINLYETLDTGAGKSLKLNCVGQQHERVGGYGLDNTTTVAGNNITISFTGINTSLYGAPVTAGAIATINLGIMSNGVYALTINNGSVKHQCTLTVSDTSYSVSDTSMNDVTFLSSEILRIPKYTIWGSISYMTASQAVYADSFTNELISDGAAAFPGPWGNFEYFVAQPGNVVVGNTSGLPFYTPFIYLYTGNYTNIQNLVQHFAHNNPDSIYISVATYDGKNFY